MRSVHLSFAKQCPTEISTGYPLLFDKQML
jgi:hypothetical protein